VHAIPTLARTVPFYSTPTPLRGDDGPDRRRLLSNATDESHMEFTVVQGDIAAQSADALVNAAGTSLRMGSGVAGALRRAAGDELDTAAVSMGPIDLGAVAVTDAYDLDADYVVHAAAMPHYGDGRATAESIRDATRNALVAADERGCSSLVIPALGCGVAGFDLAEGARIICETIDGYQPSSLSDARFIAYSDAEYETIRRVASAVRE
jgi:O-acetyl-ADP-ribose deacetylase (regulator of RNase III)